MSKQFQTFIEQCITGDALSEEIDEFIEQWHDAPGTQSLHDYLGMTRVEYSLWVADPDILPYIITGHRDNVPATKILEDTLPLAARSETPSKALALMNWLKLHGKLD